MRVCVSSLGAQLTLLVCVVFATPLYGQSSVNGQWTDVFTWGQGGGVEAIHVHMLPTGKVMFWQTWRESIGLWDPDTDQFSSAAYPNPTSFNPFCSGHAWLPDGRLFVGGGHITNDNGLDRANIYDPFTNTWANNVPNMPSLSSPPSPYTTGQRGRWYPSATTLGNGDILMLSGGMNGNFDPDSNPLPQIYEFETNSWRSLTTAYKSLPLYPRTFLTPDGGVVSLSNYGDDTDLLDVSGTGSWQYLGDTLDSNLHNYGPAVMYDTGKIAYIGGGHVPTANISLLDLTDATPSWTYGADTMAQPRRQNNATILADGTVLLTGGTYVTGWNDPNGLVTVAEIWDPTTQQVTQVAEADSSIYRGYHSTALLLPDGRVLVTGGDHDTGGFQQNLNAEIYSPAYLFAPDGSPAVRPEVGLAPSSAALGDSIFVETPDAASITKALWVIPGSVTHAQNWTQRANNLDFVITDGGLNIDLPSSGNEAPPGYYMLFLVDDKGVPSIAHWIQAELASTPEFFGDVDGDLDVDGNDFLKWQRGESPNPLDSIELATWHSNYGFNGSVEAVLVPEPIFWGLYCGIFCGVGLLSSRVPYKNRTAKNVKIG
ncbi:galactose oxidase early set domain-containing protein [Bythopirellula goksoeyrii]|uniref:Uncharacterized protein n=1 Tax=Bythopirellula goksoeyrii TaxID=1400387 RepID=A0A5B9Q3Y6_9BACT|nr:galactose oxidase early set domain-containing protein [Bythopirellula goksoeyrii]QEG33748.1 hypothetical protein Pr1d_10180 [Bythopirellula goksoeyrii]